jgi:hypothetical protein
VNAPINGDDLLARVQPTLKEVRVQICLRPDLIDQWNTLNAELEESLAQAGGGRLSDGGPTAADKKKARAVQALEKDIEAASAWFMFRAMPSEKYEALCAEHPPKKGDQFDLLAGYDRVAVGAVIVRKCLVDPVFSDEGWETFKTTCGPSEWEELRNAAFEANGGVGALPKSQAASQVLSRRGSASA